MRDKSGLFVGVVLGLVLAGCSEQYGADAEESNYQQARAVFWRNLYPTNGETLYCRQHFDTEQREGVNIEHVFPMAWATKALECGTRKQCRVRSSMFNTIEADLHNLFPARSDVNKQRGAFRFGEISGESRAFGQRCDFEVDHRSRVVEPPLVARGDIARAMFYMAYQYRDQNLVIFKKQARLLHQWHQSDPPDQSERRRNDIIEKLQGRRNPFIDAPETLSTFIAEGVFY
jgi:deoxyribonuclease-1